VDCVVDACARFADHRLELRPVRCRTLDLRELPCEPKRLVDELDGLDEPVRDPELERLRRGQQLVLAQGVQHDHLRRRLWPDQVRQELGAAPRRDDRERHLGEADVANVRREGAGGAVERELEPAAERCAVDRRDRGERQRADATEEPVTGSGSLECVGRRAELRELVDVGADAEDKRLPREDRCGPVAVLELVEHLHRRRERRPSECRRLAVVLAVVDRDERDRAGAVQLEDGVAHAIFSQRIAQPMPIPMHRAVSP